MRLLITHTKTFEQSFNVRHNNDSLQTTTTKTPFKQQQQPPTNNNSIHTTTPYNNNSLPKQLQFNSIPKTLFKDGDMGPGAIQTCEQYNNFSYINTKQHRFIGQTQANTTYTFIQNISINTHT